MTPTVDELRGVVLTRGLVALDTPDTLIASPLGEDPSSTRPAFLRSTDAGCSWSPMGTNQSQPPPTLVAAPGGRAYAWTFSPPHLSVIAGDVVEDLPLPAAVSAIRGFAVDAADPDQLALGDRDGVVWRSTDGGHSWSEIGTKPPSNDPFLPIVHRVAFDPHDLDHVMVGMSSTGAFVSGDGGRNGSAPGGSPARRQKGATVFETSKAHRSARPASPPCSAHATVEPLKSATAPANAATATATVAQTTRRNTGPATMWPCS